MIIVKRVRFCVFLTLFLVIVWQIDTKKALSLPMKLNDYP